MNHAGFDCDAFPGVAEMAWLKANTNLTWCGFYLGPVPSHRDVSWMPNRPPLVGQGWGLAPIYVGQQVAGPGSHLVVGSQGALDGADAWRLAVEAGFPPGSRLFLDLENGPPLGDNQAAYVDAWADAVQTRGYAIGVYCSHLIASDVDMLLALPTRRPPPAIWAFRVASVTDHSVIGHDFPAPNPAGSGYPLALAWQREQDVVIEADERPLLVDLSTSLTSDPSTP